MRDVVDAQQDRAGLGIHREVIEHVPDIDVRHVPQRRQQREANPARRRPIEHHRHQRAGLTDKGEIAVFHPGVRVACVQAARGHHDAEARRSNDAQAVRLGRIQYLLPKSSAIGMSEAIEIVRDHHRGARAACAEIGDQPRDFPGGEAITARSAGNGRSVIER